MTTVVGSDLLQAALEYASYGWRVVPLYGVKDDRSCTCYKGARCSTPGKHPCAGKEWQKQATADEGTITEWWTKHPDSNVGVAIGPGSGLVDFECDDAEEERILLALFGGNMPVTACFRSNRGKHWLFRWRKDLPGGATYKVGKLVLRIGNNDLGSQSVFPPSEHFKGGRYTWIAHPSDVPVAEIPDSVLARIWNWDGIENSDDEQFEDERAVAREAIKWVPSSLAENYHQWIGVGMALRSVGDDMLPVWDQWSQQCPQKYEPGKCAEKWKSFDNAPNRTGKSLGIGSLIHWARQAGWTWKSVRTVQTTTQSTDTLLDFATREAQRSPNIDDPQEQADLYAKIEGAAQTKFSPGPPAEVLREIHKTAIDKSRRESKQTASVRCSYTEHGLRFERGQWLPGEWKLTIVESDPVEYKLHVPRWRDLTATKTGTIALNVKEYREAAVVAEKVQEATSTVILDATPGVWTAIWNGLKGNKKEGTAPRRGLKAALIDEASREQPPASRKRYVVVAEIFQDLLDKARPVHDVDEPSPRRVVIRSDGTIWFRWKELWKSVLATREVGQLEIQEISTRLGLRKSDSKLWPPRGEHRVRYCVITQEVMKRLRDIIDDGDKITETAK